MVEFSIIIVNWNTKDFLRGCINSIYANNQNIDFEIIVIDNNSSDGSCKFVKSEHSDVKLICNTTNEGYAKANNRGIKESNGKYLVLLNPDTELLNNILVEFENIFKNNPGVGIIGSNLITPSNKPQRWARGHKLNIFTTINHYFLFSEFLPKTFRGFVDNQNHENITDMDWVSGACLAIHRKVIDQIGFLDESIFMYSEDMEFCYRAKRAGYQVLYTPHAKVMHHVSQGMKNQKSEKILSTPFTSMVSLYEKLYGSKGLFLFKTVILIGSIIRVVARLGRYKLHPNGENREYWQKSKTNYQYALKIFTNQ